MYGVGDTTYERLETILMAFVPVLSNVPKDQPLKSLNLQCVFLTYSCKQCQDMLDPQRVWPILDQALDKFAENLSRKMVKVNLTFKLVFGGMYSDWSVEPTNAAGLKEIVEMVSRILPKAQANSKIDMNIVTELCSVGEYPDSAFKHS